MMMVNSLLLSLNFNQQKKIIFKIELLHKSSSSNDNDDAYIKWKPAVIDNDLEKSTSSTKKDSKLIKSSNEASKVLFEILIFKLNFIRLLFNSGFNSGKTFEYRMEAGN
jgi:hypothetical protein